MQYSYEFKAQAVEKALGRGPDVPFNSVAQSCGIDHSTLRRWVATFCLNEMVLPGDSEHRFVVVPEPMPLQKKAFELLGMDLGKFVPSKLTG